ncbi:hypothetical protein BKA70DRAFT_1452631 [Coprinopsis sp. MPI-PUGE-AT-0042]|nr:hypothetical protein BKA70DRAFT_1452631 [Coprinopsis sp. MPI-PUGE-AT-0042]
MSSFNSRDETILQHPEGHPSNSGTRYQQPYVAIYAIPQCILHGPISTIPSRRPSTPGTARSTNVKHCPDLVHLELREIQNPSLGTTIQVGGEEHRGITDKDADDLSKETALLRITLAVQIIEMVTTLTPTLGGREVWRVAPAGGSDDTVSAEASGTGVNGGATVTVPAEESAANDELASQTYQGDGLQEGEKCQRWWPDRKEPSSPAVVEVGGDGGNRKQIVLLSGHVNPSSAPVQMEEGHVNLGYGGPRSPAMDMGDAGSSLFTDVQPYPQL